MGLDIVISKTRKTYLPGLVAARTLGVPHVVHVGSSPKSTKSGISGTLNTLSVRSRLRAPHDGYLVVCDELQNELTEIGVSPEQIYDVKNAVDTDRFHPERVPTPLNTKHRNRIEAFTDRGFLLGFVGGLHPYKGLDDLAEAMDHVDADCGIVVAGDGPERERLERRFGEDGLFLGPIPYNQMPALYRCIDALVLPSHTEGLPRVVLEAQATATPVVATRVGGVPEVIADEETGLLCDPHDPTGLASQLDRLADDKTLADRLGRDGRATVETEFSWSRLYERYERYLRRVITR